LSERRIIVLQALLLLAAILAGVSVLWLRFNAAPGGDDGQQIYGFALQTDLIHHFMPMIEGVAQRLRAGEIPLWNPHLCSGIPQLAAVQNAALYPGTWLAVFMPVSRAIPLLMFTECVLAGWLCALFLRALGRGLAPSAMGGVIFVFMCVLGQVLWPPMVSTLMWLPWILLCIEMLARRPHAAWFCGLGLGVALQVLAGYPQLMLYGYLLSVPYAGARLVVPAIRGSLAWRVSAQRAALIAGAVILGAGIAAVQLLPTIEMLGESARETELSPEEIHYLNARDPRIVRGVVRASVEPATGDIVFALGNSGGYLGIAPLLLLVLGVVTGVRSARTWLWLLLGTATLLLADGYRGYVPELFDRYVELPVLGSLRTPERMRFVGFFCAMMLAAAGFDRIARPAALGRRRLLEGLTLAAAVVVAIVMLRSGSGAYAWRVPVAAALILALIEAADRPVLRRLASAALLLFVIADLAIATGVSGFLREIPVGLSDHFFTMHRGAGVTRLAPGAFEQLREQSKLQRLELYHFLPRVATAPSDGGYRMSCYEPLVPGQWPALTQRMTGLNIAGMSLHGIDPREFPTVYDVASVRRIVVPKQESGYEIVKNRDALPRAYLVNRFELGTQEEILDRIAAGDAAFRDRVLLERDPGLAPSLPAWSRLRRARITSYSPERVVIEVDSPAPALLVLTDTHYPGWHAEVDGREAEILRANGVYRAVAVAPGEGRVVFEYRPASFRRGALISAVSLLLLVAGGVGLARSSWARGAGSRQALSAGAMVLCLALLLGPVGCSRDEGAPPEPEPSARSATSVEADLPAPQGIVLITVDTLRADHLGSYGAGGSGTPNIDRLAREGTLFEGAAAPMPITRPSHFSILTAQYPREHGVLNNTMSLPDSALTLAEILQGHGWRTGAFVATRLMAESSGAAQGFEVFHHPPKLQEVRARAVIPGALAWRAGLEASERFFMWIHLFDPHQSYNPPKGFRGGLDPELAESLPGLAWGELLRVAEDNGGDVTEAVLDHALALYRGEVEFTDHWIGELLAGLSGTTGLDDLLIVLTADHGECFENGVYFEHSDCLWEGATRIPLILRYPPRFAAGARIPQQVSSIDIAPTLLEAAGIEAPESYSGLSLLSELPGDRYVLIQHPFYLPGTAPGPRRMHWVMRSVAGEEVRWTLPGMERIGLVGRKWKYLRSSEGEELYPMAPVPREGVNLAGRNGAERERLGALLDAELERRPLRTSEPGEIDDELLESLKALGYAE